MKRRLLTIAAGLVLASCGFSEDERKQVEASIHAEYAKRPGAKVIDVGMVQTSTYGLTGYVKLTPQGLPKKMSGYTITIDCYATKALEIYGGAWLWRCGEYQGKP